MFLKVLAIILAILTVLYGSWNLIVSAADELIVGRAAVIDGDTVEIGTRRVRLFGVDALELGQVCDYKGRKWQCGYRAARDLAKWLGQATIVCRRRANSNDRAVASCTKGVVDVAGWIVTNGFAVAEPRHSKSYLSEQERARASRAGMWASSFDLPKVWRHQHQ
ncbi:MAG TPA: thermonuclease family protein [Vicinamibacterales bacterium]|nr:thermonuclease family protein [Vicinamibacterales bacterium]